MKSHYGRSSPSAVASEQLKARVPLVPTDLDLGTCHTYLIAVRFEVFGFLHYSFSMCICWLILVFLKFCYSFRDMYGSSVHGFVLLQMLACCSKCLLTQY